MKLSPFEKYKYPGYVNPPKIIYVKEPYFEYRQFELEDKDIPTFAKAIFTNPFIKSEMKQEFLKNFLLKYLKDPEFYEENKEKYIVVLNNTKYVIVNDHDEGNTLNSDQIGGRLFIHIGELPKVNHSI